MLAALKYIVIAAILLAIAWWVFSLPGDVTAHVAHYTIICSTPAALVLLCALALLFTILIRVIGGVRRAPGRVGAWRGGRRQKLGDIATQRGIVALAAGDAAAARIEAGRARKLLGDTPLVLLLTAEAARLAGQAEQAKTAFAQLTGHKEMAFLGHRGLLRHSMEDGDHAVAASHALSAQDAYPGSTWLRGQRLDLAVKQRDWRSALTMTKEPREIAALAAQAAREAQNQATAFDYAKKAVKADPSLAPAVVAFATALRGLAKPRAAKKALLAGWKTAPNPLISQAFLATVATPIERAQAAAELAAANPGHPESELVLAETALAARLTGEAQRHAGTALAAGAKDGRAENVLAVLDGKPPTARPGAGWECDACHMVHADWTPTCPNCGKLGTLRWTS
jgi:HemY protein